MIKLFSLLNFHTQIIPLLSFKKKSVGERRFTAFVGIINIVFAINFPVKYTKKVSKKLKSS